MEKKEIYDMAIQELIEKALSVRRETYSSDEKQFYETLKEKIRADQRSVETVVRRRVSDRRRLYCHHKSDCTERM